MKDITQENHKYINKNYIPGVRTLNNLYIKIISGAYQIDNHIYKYPDKIINYVKNDKIIINNLNRNIYADFQSP